MKANNIDDLVKQIQATVKDAEKYASNIANIKDSVSVIHNEVINNLKTKEEKEKYNKFVKVSNGILNNSHKKSYQENINSIEELMNYGKSSSRNKA